MKKAFSQGVLVSMLVAVFVVFVPQQVSAQSRQQLIWDELPSLPDKIGSAGMFAGVSNDHLICMGGANFWGDSVRNGEDKTWYDNIYLYSKKDSKWNPATEKLPRPMAFGISATFGNKIILVGGNNKQGFYPDVYTVEYRNGGIVIDTLPSLPFPLANMTGALVGNTLFVAGGDTSFSGAPGKAFLSFTIDKGSEGGEWISLESWPGVSRNHAVSASLSGEYYLFSGFNFSKGTDSAGAARAILKDAYKFIPSFENGIVTGGKWEALSEMPEGVAAFPNPAPVFGLGHIVFPGITNASGYSGHRSEYLLGYNVKTDNWVLLDSLYVLPFGIAAPAVKWNNEWVIPTVGNGYDNASAKVFTLSKNLQFGWVNWFTLFLYFVGVLWIGYIYSKQERSSQDFFTASGKIPAWAAGLSIFGTQLSAISFMAVPAVVFATDWSLAIGGVMILSVVPIVVKFYIPFFRRLNAVSAYEYLEHRFNKNVRTLGSISFILFQLGRMGIVLYLPSVAIASITGMNVYACIAVTGVVCTIYTFWGGMEAVIWTDVLQVFVLMGGAILCLFIAAASIDGGFSTVLTEGGRDGKFKLYQPGWRPDTLTLWVSIVGFFFLNLIPYTSDQTVVQKYLTVKDERATRKSLSLNSYLSLLTIPIFMGLGTILYVFYKSNPAKIPSEEVGEILPFFIVQELPIGVAGLVIAGIFAASQSTLSASLNSIATSYISDIHSRLNPRVTDQSKLKLAKQITILMGVLGIVIASAIAALKIEFIFDLFQEVLGIVAGSLAGVFILGIFTKRGNAYGVIMGMITSVVVVFLFKSKTDISVYLYGAISVVTCVLVGYLFSLLLTQSNKDVNGLTYFSLEKKGRK